MRSVLRIGHRGAKGYIPENTLPSFQHAMDLGCDYVELDVYSVGEELLVIHDKHVDRTTNGHGLIEELTLNYLRSLDAGNGAKIPTLTEVLDLVGGKCGINVELKGQDTALLVCDLLANYTWSEEKVLLSSFDHEELAKTDPKYRRGALFEKLVPDRWQQAQDLAAWSMNFSLNDVTTELVDEAHQRGYKVLVYTVNKIDDIKRMLDCGVDGIFSDYPDRVLN